jgi:hypothetical protein
MEPAGFCHLPVAQAWAEPLILLTDDAALRAYGDFCGGLLTPGPASRRQSCIRATTAHQGELSMYYGHNSLWGILVLVADIWAIVNIFQSNSSTERKVLWTVLVILLPVLGFIVWLITGPRTGRA